MKFVAEAWMFAGMPIFLIASIAGCATQPAPGIKGSWKPLNRFAETTEAIPLHQSYVYYPSPTDRTLKAMLARWAKDSNMTLSYLHPADFTLHTPVTQVRTNNLQEAVSLLTRIYADQQISITANQNTIAVKTSEPDASNQASAGGGTTITK